MKTGRQMEMLTERRQPKTCLESMHTANPMMDGTGGKYCFEDDSLGILLVGYKV